MKLYRYQKACHEETLRDWDNNSNVKIILNEYEVIRNTPKGFIIKVGSKERFVSATSKKRFAYTNHSDAMMNFVKRTKRSISIMKHYIDYSQLALKYAEEELLKIGV